MAVKRVTFENFTVFEKLDIKACKGINVFIGENGTGKTHVMKVLYSACQAARTDVSFSHKLVKVFRPDGMNISRLVTRSVGGLVCRIKVYSDTSTLSAEFDRRTKKWDANVTGEEKWERQLGTLTSTFIPAKEILSNSWNFEAAVNKNNIDFDDTYVDIVAAAKIDVSSGRDNADKKKYLDILQKITQGKAALKDDKFYLRTRSENLEFQLVAEGIRKVALLWQLIKNGTLEKGAVLFWDEPEANINPVHIPVIVDLLLELQKSGVQIFISTHDYILAKYFEVKAGSENEIKFYSMYKSGGKVLCETEDNFRSLKNNPITDAFNRLLDEVYDSSMGE